MIVALRANGYPVEREKALEVCFRGEVMGMFRADLIVAERVTVELKRTIDRNHQAQPSSATTAKQLHRKLGFSSTSEPPALPPYGIRSSTQTPLATVVLRVINSLGLRSSINVQVCV
jgi:hypothetical protein